MIYVLLIIGYLMAGMISFRVANVFWELSEYDEEHIILKIASLFFWPAGLLIAGIFGLFFSLNFFEKKVSNFTRHFFQNRIRPFYRKLKLRKSK